LSGTHFGGFRLFRNFAASDIQQSENRLRFHDDYNKYYAENQGFGPDLARTNGRNLLNSTEFHTLSA